MNRDFYIRFENKFRGSREEIKKRLQIYLPMIEQLKAIYPDLYALDIGCGRGEWLEVLLESGHKAVGIDLDEGMVAHCKSIGFAVECIDALNYLKSLNDDSVYLVTAFHVVEHVEFDYLIELLREAHRVLAPGGLLILETPNPENVLVGTCDFYIDPTHKRPIPPPLLEFLAEEGGFLQNKILRLNGKDRPASANLKDYVDWIFHAYPDYAIISQKQPSKSTKAIFDYISSLSSERTSALEALACKMSEFDSQKNALESQVKTLEAQKSALELQVSTLTSALASQNAKVEYLQQQLTLLLNSRSWKLTMPLRVFVQRARRIKHNISTSNAPLIYIAKKSLKYSILIFLKILLMLPLLRNIASFIITKIPALNIRFRYLIDPPSQESQHLATLSKREKEIYDDLLEATKGKQK